ncbi:MAG: RES family NAD+ phosphorylase [Thermoleophilaceae bacterium]
MINEWEARRPVVRCHHSSFGATEFNRTASAGRFRPVRSRGRIVGTLYGADSDAGAVAEHVFRPVPVAAEVRRVRRARLVPLLISTIAVRRALRLAALHGNGPRRLGATRAQLIDSEADQYPALSAWGQALHDCRAEPDGLVWRSRQYDDAYVLVLFADRVPRRELEVVEPPLPLAIGRGLDRVMELAEQAGITLVE